MFSGEGGGGGGRCNYGPWYEPLRRLSGVIKEMHQPTKGKHEPLNQGQMCFIYVCATTHTYTCVCLGKLNSDKECS